MTYTKNNLPIYAEERTIEQTAEEKIKELTEKLKVLQEELTEKEEENEELDKLVWKGIEKLEKKEEEERELNGQVNQLTTQINDLTTERNNRPNITHREYNNLVQERDNIQNLLGINNLNNLPPLPEGETLTSLLARPTPADLQAEQNRVNDSERRNDDLWQEKNNMQTQRDDRPNITLAQWNNDYNRRPTQQQLNNLQIELNNIKENRDYYQKMWNNHTCLSTPVNEFSDYPWRHYRGNGDDFGSGLRG